MERTGVGVWWGSIVREGLTLVGSTVLLFAIDLSSDLTK